MMVPMKNGQRQTKRAQAAEEGKYTRGPAGNKEVGCGTLSFYDEEGERLSTIRMARMPEVKKATLKAMLSKEVNSCLAERPDLKVVKVADGAKDNWTYLSGELPDGEEVIDFYHAAGHLNTALAAAYGDTHPKRSAQFEKLRHVLVEDDKGVEKVIRSLVHLRDTYPRRKKIARELKYFRRNRHRMRYAVLKKQGLPIGSGVTEAACKTLATQRLKRSGMRWGEQRPSHSILPSSRAKQSSEPGPCSHIPTRRRLRLSTMSCRYAIGKDESTQYNAADLVAVLAQRGWTIPAFSLPPAADHVNALRMNVRERFSRDMADLLIGDIKQAIDKLEETHSEPHGTVGTHHH